jgi:hypothetical protein
VSDVQARLIAAALALVAGAIFSLARPQQESLGNSVMIVAGVLFVVEYLRAQPPAKGGPG